MELGTISSSSYLQPQLVEPRGVRNVTREISGTPESVAAINKERQDNAKRNPSIPNNSDSLKAAGPSNTSESQLLKSARTERENQQTAQASEAQSLQKQEIPISTGGSIKLEVEDGDSVLKVFDSKDVLIYQLPPKGELMLIKAQEIAQKSQVQTSA